MADLLWYIIFWNTIESYFISITIFLLLYFFVFVTRNVIIKKAKKIVDKTKNKRDDAIVKKISSISRLSYIVICLYFPLKYLYLNKSLDKILEIALLFVVLREISNILMSIIKYMLENNIKNKHWWKKDTTKINLFFLVSKIIVYIIWALIFLSNIWVEITPLIASLWVAWIAVAFALQKILWDIFSSFSIFLDRPFEIGDFVTIWTDNWYVKDIWLKSTRIDTLHWHELIIPNTEVTSSRINNYGKMQKRRILFNIWVIYQTSPDIIEKIPSIIENIIQKTDNTEFVRAHFIEFGKSELNFEIVYYITNDDYSIYRDTHQKICLEIMKSFKEKWISFAYPTQSIYIENPK